jgi:hypothetical protein
MSAANPNPMEKSMLSVLVVANAGGGGHRCCVVEVIATFPAWWRRCQLWYSGMVVGGVV